LEPSITISFTMQKAKMHCETNTQTQTFSAENAFMTKQLQVSNK